MNDEKREEQLPEKEGGVSLREIFSIIGKKIWYVLGGTLLVTIVAVLIFMFAINPFTLSNSMSFQISYPKFSSGKYPDGSMFDYQDIVSKRVINAVKNNPEYEGAFSAIDTQKVIKNDGLSITAKNSGDGYVYTISLKKYCFKGIDAKDFIEALTETYQSEVMVNDKIIQGLDFQLDVAIFEQATFKDQVVLLSEQKSTIVNQYNGWISEYSAGRIVNGKPLSSYRAESITMFADNIKTSIENTLTFNGYEYFNKHVTGDEVKARVEQLQNELKLDLAILAELKKYYTESAPASQTEHNEPRSKHFRAADSFAGGTEEGGGTTGGDIVIMPGDSDLSQKMAYYSERAAILQQQIMRLTNLEFADETTDISSINFDKTAGEIKAFGEKYLDKQLQDMNAKAATLKSIIRMIYTTDTAIIFQSQKLDTDGSASLLLVGIGTFIVAFLVFAVIAYVKNRKHMRAQRQAQAASAAAVKEDKADTASAAAAKEDKADTEGAADTQGEDKKE